MKGKQMKKVALAIVGATTAGVAAAAAWGEGALLLEKGMLLGAEFGAAMCAAPYAGDQTAPFFRACLETGVMDAAGRLHPAGLSPLLAGRLKESAAEPRLFTRLLEARPCPGGYALNFMDAEGLHACVAERLLLTTHDAQPGAAAADMWKKYLCAQLCCVGGEEIACARGEDWDIVQGTLRCERIFRLALPREADWPAARRRLHRRFLAAREDVLAGWQLAAVASSFFYEFDRPVCRQLENGMWYLPSASFGGPAEAYAGGAACAINIG